MRKRETLVAAVAALLLAVVTTWPLAAGMSSRVPHDLRFQPATGADMHIWLWDFWWARQVVERGVAPFQCDMIFYPWGHTLALHTHGFLWGLLSVPLQWIGGLPFALDGTLLLLFALTGAATFALGRELGLGRAGAGLAAFAWTFSPYFVQKGLEHVVLSASPWPPLLVLFLLRWMNGSGGTARPGGDVRATRIAALACGIVTGLALLTSLITLPYLVLLGGLVVLVAPSPRADGTRGSRGGLALPTAWLLAAAAAILIGLPWILNLAEHWSALSGAAGRSQLYHPRLVDFVTPSGLHPLFAGNGAAEPPAGAAFAGLRNEDSALYVGLTTLVLAALALAREPRARRWALVGLPLFLLAWDPGPDPEGWLSSLYRGYSAFELLRVPARLAPFAFLPLMLVAGMGFDRLVRGTRASLAVAVALAALLVLEFWTGPYPTMEFLRPQAARAIALCESEGAVASLPFAPGANVAMSWQTVHEKPVLSSYVARADPEPFENWRALVPDLVHLALGESLAEPAVIALDLETAGVDHVLVRADSMREPELLYRILDEMEGWERAATTDGVEWWYATARVKGAREALAAVRD